MAQILRGETEWAGLDPAMGHEQSGQRPMLIPGNDVSNQRPHTMGARSLGLMNLEARKAGKTASALILRPCPLAAKRWFYYTREGATVASLAELRAAIRRNKRAEPAFLMVASAEWAGRSRFLALAYFPRSWCHHLVLDFLAVRPGVSLANQPIRGIGSGILATLAGLADSLGMGIMWGEATAGSASFYERALRIRSVRDFFVIRQGAMRSFRARCLSRMKHRLAETGWRRHYCGHADEAKTRLA